MRVDAFRLHGNEGAKVTYSVLLAGAKLSGLITESGQALPLAFHQAAYLEPEEYPLCTQNFVKISEFANSCRF